MKNENRNAKNNYLMSVIVMAIYCLTVILLAKYSQNQETFRDFARFSHNKMKLFTDRKNQELEIKTLKEELARTTQHVKEAQEEILRIARERDELKDVIKARDEHIASLKSEILEIHEYNARTTKPSQSQLLRKILMAPMKNSKY